MQYFYNLIHFCISSHLNQITVYDDASLTTDVNSLEFDYLIKSVVMFTVHSSKK